MRLIKNTFLLLLFALPFLGISQSVEKETSYDEIYTTVDTMPEFPGGQAELFKFILKNIKIKPDSNISENSKVIYLNFIVGKD